MADEEKVIKKPRGRKKTEATKSDITLESLQTQMAQLMQMIQTQNEQLKAKDEEIENLKQAKTTRTTTKKNSSLQELLKEDPYITIKSAVKGILVVETRNDKFIFTGEGQTEQVRFTELRSLKNSKPQFFTLPLFYVEDEEVVEVLGLNGIYENLSYLKDLPTFFNTNTEEDAYETLSKLPNFTRLQVFGKLKDLYESKKFVDVDVRNLIRSKFGYDIFNKD